LLQASAFDYSLLEYPKYEIKKKNRSLKTSENINLVLRKKFI